MNPIKEHLDKNNLHHAYLIEGMHEEIVPTIFEFLKEINISTVGNPDFSYIIYDSLKIEDARNLKSKSLEKGFSLGKKIYVISANNFLLDAQNTLLKMFEEPIENTHFFVIVPDADTLLSTLVSRFYFIKSESKLKNELREAEKFISLSLKDRIAFIKDLLIEEDENEDQLVNTNTPRSKSLKFLNALELALHDKYLKTKVVNNTDFFEQIFKVREFLRQPGSSAKSLMESIAISIPVF
jgi:DNA polymerase III delta prime subunit